MNFCIYYKSDKSNNLSFSSREHIIPAGLGGKRTLPKGYVSDQANNSFSNIESKALNDSLIAGIRTYLGPGSRGSKVYVKKDGLVCCPGNYNPQVHVLKSQNTISELMIEEYYKLGFMYDKHTMCLPQVLYTFDNRLTLKSQVYSPGEFDNECNNVGIFFNRLVSLKSSMLKNEVKTQFSPRGIFIIIGCFYNRWFYYINIPFVTLEQVLAIIHSQNINVQKSICAIAGAKYDFSFKLDGGFNDGCFQFLFVKTAFNVLAYHMGQEFVLGCRFDRLRDLILGKTHYNVLYSCNLSIINKWFNGYKDNAAHIVRIDTISGKLFAFVSFYGDMIYEFEMAQDITEYIHFAYICDWKNGKEWIENLG